MTEGMFEQKRAAVHPTDVSHRYIEYYPLIYSWLDW